MALSNEDKQWIQEALFETARRINATLPTITTTSRLRWKD